MLLVSNHVNCETNYAEIETAAFEKITGGESDAICSIILNNYNQKLSPDMWHCCQRHTHYLSMALQLLWTLAALLVSWIL
jgi:hypothetical protein